LALGKRRGKDDFMAEASAEMTGPVEFQYSADDHVAATLLYHKPTRRMWLYWGLYTVASTAIVYAIIDDRSAALWALL
jgi:hypothetical protein